MDPVTIAAIAALVELLIKVGTELGPLVEQWRSGKPVTPEQAAQAWAAATASHQKAQATLAALGVVVPPLPPVPGAPA